MADELNQQQGAGDASGTSEGGLDMGAALKEMSEDLFPEAEAVEESEVKEGEGNPEGVRESNSGEKPTNAADTPETPAAKPDDADVAPKTWTKEAQEHWATIPPRVKQEILKREADMFKGLEGYKQSAELGNSLRNEVSPYIPLLKSQQRDPMKLIGQMMNTHYTLSMGNAEAKVGVIRELAKNYGVELSGIFEEPAYVDPQVAGLQKELGELKSRLNQQTELQTNVVRQELEAKVSAFISDPKNVYVNEVTNDMVTLLTSGVCKTLEEAYEKAVWQNPITRAKEQDRLTADRKAKEEAEAKKKADEARAAMEANVKSRARSGGGTAKVGSMDDTMAETLAKIRARDK